MDKYMLEKILTRNRHLTMMQQAERLIEELGLYRQHATFDVYERDGMSLSTRKARPHSRWVSEWEQVR